MEIWKKLRVGVFFWTQCTLHCMFHSIRQKRTLAFSSVADLWLIKGNKCHKKQIRFRTHNYWEKNAVLFTNHSIVCSTGSTPVSLDMFYIRHFTITLLQRQFRHEVQILCQHRHDRRHLFLVHEDMIVWVVAAHKSFKEVCHFTVDTCQYVHEVARIIVLQHFTQSWDKHCSSAATEWKIACHCTTAIITFTPCPEQCI